MAGVLPGVEAARIRRIHQRNLYNDGSTRRSSFCLYATNYQEFNISSPSSEIRRQGCDDERLDAAARDAKERLDRRLQNHWKIGNHKSKGKQKNKTDQLCEKWIIVEEWIPKILNWSC